MAEVVEFHSIEIPLRRVSKSEPEEPTYRIGSVEIEAFKAAFPNINVETELQEIRSYCMNNPLKRWTFGGIGRALHENLRRKNDRAVSREANASARAPADPVKQRGVERTADENRHTWAALRVVYARFHDRPLDEEMPGNFKLNLSKMADEVIADVRRDYPDDSDGGLGRCEGTMYVRVLRALSAK